jgi:CRP/FNR family transcriptional regulator, cyclic AMP receptor protein
MSDSLRDLPGRAPVTFPAWLQPSPTPSARVATLRGVMSEHQMLETTQLLGALPPDALEKVRSASTVRDVARNEVLFVRGDPASELFGIISGRVAILTKSPDGRESLVAVLDEGSLFGELGLFDNGPRSADARALEPTQVLVLDYEDVRRAIQAEPKLLWVIIRVLARRLRTTDDSLADAVFLDVPGRTAKRLLELSGDKDEFRLRMTQEDLAGLVGASRERVNKALSMFTRLGWLEVEGRNRYHILNRTALEDRAEL